MKVPTWPEPMQPWIAALRGKMSIYGLYCIPDVERKIESVRCRMSELLTQAYSSISLQHVQLALGFDSAQDTAHCKNDAQDMSYDAHSYRL